MGAPTFDRDEAGDPAYAFKASLNGAMCEFALKPEAMHWQKGRRSGRLRYERIRAIRLSYRPVSMQSHRFVTEIWSADNPKIQIVSVTWRSMIQQERLDGSYSAFITELHRKLAVTRSAAHFSTGLPVVTYWIGIVIFTGVLIATGALTMRSMHTAQWSAMAVIGMFLAMFVWQLGNYFRRNWPARYQPDAIPKNLLPGG